MLVVDQVWFGLIWGSFRLVACFEIGSECLQFQVSCLTAYLLSCALAGSGWAGQLAGRLPAGRCFKRNTHKYATSAPAKVRNAAGSPQPLHLSSGKWGSSKECQMSVCFELRKETIAGKWLSLWPNMLITMVLHDARKIGFLG